MRTTVSPRNAGPGRSRARRARRGRGRRAAGPPLRRRMAAEARIVQDVVDAHHRLATERRSGELQVARILWIAGGEELLDPRRWIAGEGMLAEDLAALVDQVVEEGAEARAGDAGGGVDDDLGEVAEVELGRGGQADGMEGLGDLRLFAEPPPGRLAVGDGAPATPRGRVG